MTGRGQMATGRHRAIGGGWIVVRLVTGVEVTSPAGGLEVQLVQITTELARRGHETDLLYVEEGPLLDDYRRVCRSVTRVPSVDYRYPPGRRRRPPAMARMTPAIWAAVRRRPDVLYGNRIFSNGWTVPARMLTGAPIVCHLHGHVEMDPSQMAFINSHVNRYIGVSRFLVDQWISTGVDPNKISVVWNGIDPDAYPEGGAAEAAASRQALGLPTDAYVVLYFGQLNAHKGVDVLLRAWRRVAPDGRDARLVVFGSPFSDQDDGSYMAELERLADDRVSFIPRRKEVVPILHAADVVVVPSVFDEPFGRTVIEAMATGRPVIASRAGGVPEILTGRFEPFLFEKGDETALADRLHRLVDWRTGQPDLAEACVRRVRDSFTLESMVDGIEGAFDEARSLRRHGRRARESR